MLDNKLKFFEDLDITTAGAKASTAVYVGDPLSTVENPGVIEVSVDTATPGTTTLAMVLQESDTEGGSYAAVLTYKTLTVSAIVKDGKPVVKIPLPSRLKPWLKLIVTVGGTPGAGGKMTAFVATKF